MNFSLGIKEFKLLSFEQKKDVLVTLLCFFSTLFGYSILRSTTTVFFIEKAGAKNTPLALFYSVLGLGFTVYFFHQLEKKWKHQNIFLFHSVITAIIFTFVFFKPPFWEYIIYLWKEIYIVISIPLLWGFINQCVKKSEAQSLFGAFSALASLGGILGGSAVPLFTRSSGASFVHWIGIIQVLATGFLFLLSNDFYLKKIQRHLPKHRINFLDSEKINLTYLVLFVCLAQICVSFIDLKLNLALEALKYTTNQRVQAMGWITTSFNSLAFLVKIFILPWLFKRVSIFTVQLFLPFIYFIILLVEYFFFSTQSFSHFVTVALLYICMKGMDYSAFSISKELFYYNFSESVRLKAKYISDMFSYRTSKGIASIGLIFLQKSASFTLLINPIFFLFLGTWFFTGLHAQLKKSKFL